MQHNTCEEHQPICDKILLSIYQSMPLQIKKNQKIFTARPQISALWDTL